MGVADGTGCWGATTPVAGAGELTGTEVGWGTGPTELAELAATWCGDGILVGGARWGGREIRATVAGPSCPVPNRAATGGTARCEAGGWGW